MEKKIKILCYNFWLNKGGTEKYFLNLCKNINKNYFEMYLLIDNGENYDKQFYQEFIEAGVKVFFCRFGDKSKIERYKTLKDYFKNNKRIFDIMYINCATSKEVLVAIIAKVFGNIKKIIFHSHMGGSNSKIIKFNFIYKILLNKIANIRLACSDTAANFVFGKKISQKNNYIMINNSVNLSQFDFSTITREKMRIELGIKKDTFVILSVARFNLQKNHNFLIDVFNEIQKIYDNSYLILVGNGELKKQIEEKVKRLNLSNKTIFLGILDDVSKIMQASDIFLMTSFHEGLPIVCVESQATGLINVLSENISKQANINENNLFISLNESSKEWAKKIISLRKYKRVNGHEKIKEKHFDNQSAISQVEEICLKLLK
ncbi:MAG: glycosyltransferase family 1 protein [Clostridia bacterium]|nr:glycosyltransferase family 1 protein [Clostridia bacterium]